MGETDLHGAAGAPAAEVAATARAGARPLAEADESVATRFTRVMNATTSRWGMFTDPAIVGAGTAPMAVALLAAMRLDAAPGVVTALSVLAVLPLALAVAITVSLHGARSRVVAWLSGLPFPIENMNALLNGLGETLEITFRAPAPSSAELNAALEPVSDECFVTKGPEDTKDPAVVEVRIGVVESKRNPSASNHRRFVRVRALVEQGLVPLGARHPIAEVRIK